ncbi:MAG TPA: TonB-dependent receptor, partial [Longimicrobiales bacterium]|nr:TonB-dependent receptor [Longimicrobiales bacterium]
REVPSAVLAQNGSQGAITSLFLRGGESDYVLVLVDGVRVNNPGGQYDFANLTLDNVERIEVVRGPVSVLYGSDAVTGVVQIFTRRQTERQVRLSARGGGGARITPDSLASDRYGASSLNLELGGSSGAFSYSAGAGQLRSGGLYAFNNQYRNTAGSARAALQIADRTALSWTGRLTDSRYHYPTDGNGRLVDRNQHRTSESFVTGVELHSQPAARVGASLRAGLSHHDERYTDLPDAASDTLGTHTTRSIGRVRRQFVELNTSYYAGTNAILTAGAELERQRDRNRYDSDGEFGPFQSRFGRERTNRAAFAQVIASAGGLSLNGGLRTDHNNRFGDFLTYRAGAAIRAAGNTRIRLAAGTAFKEPTFFENYAEGFTKGNPHLEPEHSRNWEIGLEQTLPSALGRVQLTVFDQRFRDLIQYVPRAPGSTEPNYENVAAAKARGAELEWSVALRPFTLTGSVSALATKALDAAAVDDPQFEPGERLLRRPEHQASIVLGYARGPVTADLRWLRIGARDDLDFSSFPFQRVRLDAYSRLDLGAAIRLKAPWPVTLTARTENLLDRAYDEILNFPAGRRTFWLGIETEFDW